VLPAQAISLISSLFFRFLSPALSACFSSFPAATCRSLTCGDAGQWYVTSESASVSIVRPSLLLPPATLDANTTVPNHHADRPVQRPARVVGCPNPQTATPSAARRMGNACDRGARATRGLGDVRPLRPRSRPRRSKHPSCRQPLTPNRLHSVQRERRSKIPALCHRRFWWGSSRT
jgi:hypothetical protein